MKPNRSDMDASNSRQKYVLAIDLGSGGHKVALVSNNGEIVASEDDQVATHLFPGGGAEQDPDEWWQKALRASKKVIQKANVPAEHIIAVGCDSQWSLAVPVDENGQHLMNAVHWLDTRGGRYNRKVISGFPSIHGYGLSKLMRWIRLAGFAPMHSGVDSLGHVLYIKNELPDIYQRTYKFLEPMDYLTSRLTGRITATQKTMAPFVIVDNRRWGAQEYSEELLALAGVEKEKFPELLPNNGVIGPLKPSIADELGLKQSTQVVTGIGDTNVSLIGSGAIEDFETIIYIGTSLFMTCHLPFKRTDLTHVMTTLPGPFEGRYYLLGEQGVGGRCVEFFLKNMVYAADEMNTGPEPEDAYTRFNQNASRAPAGSEGVIFLPWLNGSITPHEAQHVRGGFMNLSLNTTRDHLCRAVMEALAYNSRWTLGPAEKLMGRRVESIRFSGGGARSNLWAQIHADVLGLPIHQIDDPVTTTVRGTAMLAFYTLGHLSSDELAKRTKTKHVYEPDDANKDIYDKMFTQYREVFKKNKSVFKSLNG